METGFMILLLISLMVAVGVIVGTYFNRKRSSTLEDMIRMLEG